MVDFSATVKSWVTKSKSRCDNVIRIATQAVIDEAQTPVAKGGRMRVDTGFLRASGMISLSGMPSGPSRRPADAKPDQFGPSEIGLTLANVKAGTKIYFGWSANYARVRNYHDGFLDMPVQRWQSFVDDAVKSLK